MEQKTVLTDKRTLLLVDDDLAILRFLSDVLATSFQIVSANSGSFALQQSEDFKGRIDLLLTDCKMPGMNGIELATQITAQRAEIKVLLMSGSPEDLTEGWQHLPKPFIASDLIALVNSLVSPPT